MYLTLWKAVFLLDTNQIGGKERNILRSLFSVIGHLFHSAFAIQPLLEPVAFKTKIHLQSFFFANYIWLLLIFSPSAFPC